MEKIIVCSSNKLFNGESLFDPLDQGSFTGVLKTKLEIMGNFMLLRLEVYDLEGNLIDFDESQDMLPKHIAKLLMRMTNFAES